MIFHVHILQLYYHIEYGMLMVDFVRMNMPKYRVLQSLYYYFSIGGVTLHYSSKHCFHQDPVQCGL